MKNKKINKKQLKKIEESGFGGRTEEYDGIKIEV